MRLHEITCDYIQLHFFGIQQILVPCICIENSLTLQCFAANMLNTHEDLRDRPGTWMVAGFLPHIDHAIAKYPKVS